MNHFGLILNTVGGVILALFGYSGTTAAFGGELVPKNTIWKWLNYAGWPILILGFILQLLSK